MRVCCVAVAVAVSCCAPTVDDGAAASVAWSELENPVFGLADVAVKDAFFVFHDDTWRLGFSHISDEPFRFRLGLASSADFSEVSVDDVIDDEAVGGLASPTVVADPAGGFVMTYNSHTVDVDGAAPKLYVRRSDDLVTWGPAVRLRVDGCDADDDRLIDAAVAFAEAGAFLFFKREQTAHVAFAASGNAEGPWTLLGDVTPGNLENGQLLQIDGAWHLLATTLPIEHRPVLHRLVGDEHDPNAWRTWEPLHELVVPREEWNDGTYPSFERSNAAFLVDHREKDGFFYVLYAGSTELGSFNNRGHARLGLARSTDLTTWTAPPR